MKTNTKKLTMTAMFTALVFIGTLIAFPIPKTTGFMNLGDCIIIICAVILGAPSAAFAGAVGATLADVTLGYFIYSPFTFIIKGLMGLIMGLLFVKTKKKKFLLIAIIGEIVMVGGYFLSETLFLPLIFEEAGFAVAVTGVPFNSIQGVVNIIVAVLCIKLLQKLKVKELREF